MKRIVLTEGRFYWQTIEALTDELGVKRYDLLEALYASDAYLCKRLAISRSLRVERDRFSFERVAGVFPIAGLFEVEVVPRFMDGSEGWRADFLLLLAHSRWGTIAERQMIGASRSISAGINDVLAIVYLSLFSKVAHVPIRTYRRQRISGFEIEGSLDEETVFLPDKEGFSQVVTKFSRCNPYNAIIKEASHQLVQSVHDFDLRTRLIKAASQLGPQTHLPSVYPRSVPSRFSNWTELYKLSVGILEGYGIDYTNQGDILSPAFVVRTASAWEEFLRRALILGMKGCSVSFQEQHFFAVRDASEVKVRPDYILRSADGRKLLVDAKYKFADARSGSISNADIYEGWAFMKATGITKLVLLYPYVGEGGAAHFEEFQHVRDESHEIVGVRINPYLAGVDGLASFAKELAFEMESLMI